MAKHTLPQAGIYCIRNLVNGRVYVGSSNHVRKRLTTHRSMLRAGRHDSPKLQNGWNAYGEEAFEFTVLETLPGSDEQLIRREQYWIDRLRASDAANGYNTAPVAGSCRGIPCPEHVKDILRSVHTGKPKSALTLQRMSEGAKKRPASWAEKNRTLRLGVRLSEEHRRATSEGRKASQKALEATLALNAKKRKLTDDQVLQIVARRKAGEPMLKIAESFGVSRRVIRAILSGETYGSLTGLHSAP
jgi:group I intron endonuclease